MLDNLFCLAVVVIVWLACAGIGDHIAGRKGNSRALGFILGLILGPVGVIIAGIVPANEQALEQRQLRRGTMRSCPFCGEPVRASAAGCRFCGHDLPSQPATLGRDPEEVKIILQQAIPVIALAGVLIGAVLWVWLSR